MDALIDRLLIDSIWDRNHQVGHRINTDGFFRGLADRRGNLNVIAADEHCGVDLSQHRAQHGGQADLNQPGQLDRLGFNIGLLIVRLEGLRIDQDR